MSATGNELVKLNQLKSTYDKFINGTTVVGRADNLKSQSTTLTSNFNFRPTASTYTNGAWVGTSIETKDGANLKSIKGKSYVRNQLVNKNDYTQTGTRKGVTFTNNNDGTWTVNGTSTSAIYFPLIPYTYINLQKNHKYMLCGGSHLNIYYADIINITTEYNCAVGEATNSGSAVLQYSIISSGITINNQKIFPHLIDLTKHFNGNSNIPSEVLNMTTLDTTILAKYGIKLDGVYEAGEVENFGQNGNVTVDFNQLVQNGNFISTSNWSPSLYGGTMTVQDNTLIYTPDGTSSSRNIYQGGLYIPVGHKVLYSFDVKMDGAQQYTPYIGISSNLFYLDITNNFATVSAIATITNENYTGLYFYPYGVIEATASSSNITYIKNVNIFDLTQMFGAGNEPSTVEEFRELYPNDYYDYTTSRSETLSLVKVKTRGFNAWDEEWESGYYQDGTGEKRANANYIRSKNKIRVFPNTTYYVKSPISLCIYGFDINENYIAPVNYSVKDNTITTGTNVNYIVFNTAVRGTTTYNHDICINLSWSGTKNGLYETYTKNTKSLPIGTYFPNGMCGIGNVYDELTERKATKKFGVYTFTGNETQWVIGGAENYIYKITLSEIGLNFVNTANVICDNYAQTNQVNENAPNMSFYSAQPYYGTNTIAFRNNSCADLNAFKSAIAGTTIVYELATPVETNIDIDLSYTCNDWGTEQLISTNSVPLNADVVYGLDVKNEVKNLRQNYISLPSFNNLANEIKSEYGITITPTFGVDQYNFSISGTPQIGGSNIATVSQVATKQDILTAGSGIDITNNIISVISGVYFEEDN